MTLTTNPPADSAAILERFRHARPNEIDLTIRPAYTELLKKLGDPQNRLPPVFHVAGTNGKGSTCAFLRAILEAAGHRVHVYTSPHLMSLHERFRIAGNLIGEDEIAALLLKCEKIAPPDGITMFEALTASAFAAFARHPADFVILETGLGGRLDATNVIAKPRATLIARLSYDHREYLGNTLTQIAKEKAGIMRTWVPCFVMAQPDIESLVTLRAAAHIKGTPIYFGDENWTVEVAPKGFRYADDKGALNLPPPALIGSHQVHNAGLAIAALRGTGFANDAAIAHGMRTVEWPARLQHLATGLLPEVLGPQGELWLDGGHNDSAGEVLAAQAKAWSEAPDPRPLHLIVGMLKTKTPAEFLRPLAPHIAGIRTVPIPGEMQIFAPDDLAAACRAAGFQNVDASPNIAAGLQAIRASAPRARVLICGSLYLAGEVLRQNAAETPAEKRA
jgi:dihydrofolate synthase/folylpolyglutamate synthase